MTDGTTRDTAAWSEVTQTMLHDPERSERGVHGNCLQAAVASVLRLDLEAVPHFVTFEWWPQALTLWAYGRRLRVCGETTTEIPERLCIVGGVSPRGVSHVVVGAHGRVVWDPHPSREGLTSVRDVTWFEQVAEDEPFTFPLPFGPVHAAAVLEQDHGYIVVGPSPNNDQEKADA